MNKKNNMVEVKGFSSKTQKYLLKLRKTDGFDYTNLIIDECKGIIYSSSKTGYCFNKKQLEDIIKVCLFEKVEISYEITYDAISTDIIDYITIINKTGLEKNNNSKITRSSERKTNIKINKKTKKTDIKASCQNTNKNFETKKYSRYKNPNDNLTMNELKEKILQDYGF